MTDEAKALDVKELCFKLFGCYMADAPEVKLLTHALAEARREGKLEGRRETWEDAAKVAEQSPNQWTGIAAYSAEQAALQVAYLIRAQAQGGGG